MSAPHDEYSQRLKSRTAAWQECDRRHFAMGNARFGILVVAALMAVAIVDRGWLSGWWLLLPVALFFWVGGRLQALEVERARLRRAEGFYERALDRVEGRWAGSGEAGLRFRDDAHLYARDLDLFGGGSMFQLLCQARTRMGEEQLADWLLAPATPATLAQRRDAVCELAPMLDLREDIAVLGEDASAGVHAEQLAGWGETPPALTSSGFRWLARVLSVLGVITIIVAIAYLAMITGDLQLDPWAGVALRLYFAVTVLALGIITWRFNARAEAIFLAAELAARDVGLLAGVLERLERERFGAPRLAALRDQLDTEGQPPSHRIARLNRLMDFVQQRDNMVVRMVGPLVLWDVHLAYALEDWRAASGEGMRRWLDAVGEIEALSSIAAYRYERPEDVFAELVEAPPHFIAEAIGHPLLPAGDVVANDVSIGGDEAGVLVVSGSNMSGKSTLLRTIGISTILAQAGVPVRARGLRLSPLGVGASIRVVDSLQEGESRFYAEILRLGAIVERAGQRQEPCGQRGEQGRREGEPDATPALLFLVDEFLHGTNSHDRRIGAEAIVRGLADRGAIGLVTTHDLALTHIADALGERGANVHFEDHLEEGKMRFDYRMRPGVVEKSNALELMRSVGLEV